MGPGRSHHRVPRPATTDISVGYLRPNLSRRRDGRLVSRCSRLDASRTAVSISRSGLPPRCIVSISTRRRSLSRSNSRSIIEYLRLSCVSATARGGTAPELLCRARRLLSASRSTWAFALQSSWPRRRRQLQRQTARTRVVDLTCLDRLVPRVRETSVPGCHTARLKPECGAEQHPMKPRISAGQCYVQTCKEAWDQTWLT